jgi:ABC-type uncharacterized transport system permease subunit
MTRRLDLTRVERPVLAGWGAVALGVLAFWLALPPLLVRTPVPSLVLALAAVGVGVWVIREGQRRLGWGAIVCGVLCAIGAIAATRSGEANLERVVVWSALAAAMLRFATPLVFAALGGVISERAGVVNIGLEGMMLVGAFFAIYGADLLGGWFLGLLLGMLAGGLLALVHAFFAVSLRADQIVSGFAINFLALGLTGYIFIHHYGDEGTPDNVPAVPDVSLPIDWIPFFGPALEKLNLLVWVALLLVFGVCCSSSARRPACGCARWGRTPAPPPRSASRSTRCATWRSSPRACWRRWAARSSPSASSTRSTRT